MYHIANLREEMNHGLSTLFYVGQYRMCISEYSYTLRVVLGGDNSLKSYNDICI